MCADIVKVFFPQSTSQGISLKNIKKIHGHLNLNKLLEKESS